MGVLVSAGYGRVVGLHGTRAQLEAVRSELPFWWRDVDAEPEVVFDLNGAVPAPSAVRDLEHWVAEHAIDHVFVHAAVVQVGGWGLVLPGPSYAGKTTLCLELLRRGATYLSDEYAVLDGGGWVHPYPRPLRVRDAAGRRQVPASDLGAPTANGPCRASAVVLTTHRASSTWSATEVAPALGALRVLEHTVAVRSRPAPALDAVRAMLIGARCLLGERGPAADAAESLMTELSG